MLSKLIWPIALLLFLNSCAKPTTEQVAFKAGFKLKYIQTDPFNLASYQKILHTGRPVNIYIEGDGRAWINHSRLSSDPSPNSATVMNLASLDPNPNVVYLARPCQYSPRDLSSVCDSKYWSLARYSTTVINAMNQAINSIKFSASAKNINLIGFSGGAAIAILVAAQRHDIASIRTVAGNLDLLAMQKYHNTTPLSESVDPISLAKHTSKIPQLHFVGKQDQIVPSIVAKNFCQAAGLDSRHIIILNSVGHHNGWLEHWPELLKYVP